MIKIQKELRNNCELTKLILTLVEMNACINILCQPTYTAKFSRWKPFLFTNKINILLLEKYLQCTYVFKCLTFLTRKSQKTGLLCENAWPL